MYVTSGYFKMRYNNAGTWSEILSLYPGSNLLEGHQILTAGNWSSYITLPTIPSISITNSGSGNAVTSITASGHTVTVTKGSTFSLSGHAHNNYLQRLQYWANGESHDADDLLTGITFAYKDKHNAPGYGTLVSFSALSMETYTL
jgi:hypothetical protein